MKLKPLGDNLIVKPLNKEEITKSGIILPDTIDKEKPEQGEVIAVGPGAMQENGQRAQMDVKVGDKILFDSYSAEKYKINDEEFLVVSQAKVVAIIE